MFSAQEDFWVLSRDIDRFSNELRDLTGRPKCFHKTLLKSADFDDFSCFRALLKVFLVTQIDSEGQKFF